MALAPGFFNNNSELYFFRFLYILKANFSTEFLQEEFLCAKS